MKSGRSKHWVAFWILCAISAAGAGWSLFMRRMAGVGIYDLNFQAFHDVLTQRQGQGIIRAAQDLVFAAILPLMLTNLLWAVAVGMALWRARNLDNRSRGL